MPEGGTVTGTLGISGAAFTNTNRRVIRAPINEMDKSTVISIYPVEVDEIKPTIQPGRFHLDAGSFEKPSTLIVTSSSWWRELDTEQPMLEIPQGSVLVAESIVRDYCNGLLACNMGDTMPGMFFLPGPLTQDMVLENFMPQLIEAQEKQKKYYAELVRLADILWARSDGNPIVITDQMKLGAQELNLKDKPWLRDFTTMQLVNCPVCGSLRDAKYPMCKHCRTIVDPTMYAELGLKQAPEAASVPPIDAPSGEETPTEL